MDSIMSYVKPELIVVAVVLYIIGVGIKKMDVIKDKYIPCILGVLGILLCAIWVMANTLLEQYQKCLWQCLHQLFRVFLLPD